LESQPRYDRLEAYGFGVDYPSSWSIMFDPKSTKSAGDVTMKSPRGYNVSLSWGELEKVRSLNGVDAHADFSVDRVKGKREAQVMDVRKDSMMVDGHRASFRDVKLGVARRRVMGKAETVQEVRSLHVHCDVSSRYFVLYGQVGQDLGDEQRDVLSRMIRGFACHRADVKS